MFTTFTNLGGSTRESGACRVTDLDKISCPPSAALSTNGFVAAGSPRPNPAIAILHQKCSIENSCAAVGTHRGSMFRGPEHSANSPRTTGSRNSKPRCELRRCSVLSFLKSTEGTGRTAVGKNKCKNLLTRAGLILWPVASSATRRATGKSSAPELR